MKSKLNLLTLIFAVLTISTVSFGYDANSQSSGEVKDYRPYPNPDRGYVTDIANILTDQEEEKIEAWLYTTEKNTNVEIVVVTIGSIGDYPGTKNNSIEDFARGLFDVYGIGNMPDNKGVLLLVAIKDRKARIELGAGYGRRMDAEARIIMNTKIVPQFRNGNYAKGITKGVEAILNEFAKVAIIPGWVKPFSIIFIIIMILISISLFLNGKRGWGWVCIGLVVVTVLGVRRLMHITVEALPDSAGPGGFGGGFGGGFSGGGGATGSW